MTDVVVLKPRRNGSPFTFNGVQYPQDVDELGVTWLHVDDPEFLKFMSENPDTFEMPADYAPLAEESNDAAGDEDPSAEESAVAAAAEDPVAVVAAEEPQPAPAGALKAKQPVAKRKSRLSA